MRKIILAFMILVSLVGYGQIPIAEGTLIHRSGTSYSHSGMTYTEVYEVLTDSIVYRFGMEFLTSDSTFVRCTPMEGCDRKVYDSLNAETQRVENNHEKYYKETVDFLNSYKASYQVWMCFKLFGILGK